MFLYLILFPDQYKTQEMCDRVVCEDPFLKVFCPDKYTTQRMCDEAIHDYSSVETYSRLVCYK